LFVPSASKSFWFVSDCEEVSLSLFSFSRKGAVLKNEKFGSNSHKRKKRKSRARKNINTPPPPPARRFCVILVATTTTNKHTQKKRDGDER
jgi:hypothetical protein